MIRCLSPLFLSLLVMTTSAFAAPVAQIDTAKGKQPEEAVPHWVVEDTHSYIGIARVNLKIGKLYEEDGKLVGTYEIRIPFSRSRNDDGRIELPLGEHGSLEELKATGGRLVGKAISVDENREPSKIECDIDIEEQAISLVITTTERSIRFASSYEFVDPTADRGKSSARASTSL